MAPIVLTNCKILLGGYNFSGESNQLALEYRAELLSDTVFNSGTTRSNVAGLLTTAFSATILFNPAEPLTGDPATLVKSYNEFLFERIGAVREVLTVAPVGEVEGDNVYFTRQVNGSYNPMGGNVGEIMSGELTGATAQNQKLVRGFLMGTGTKTVSGNGTGLNLGTVAEGKTIYSALHVFDSDGAGGETLDVVIESDTANTFLAPTTRLTHTQFTASKGASWQQATLPAGGGGITDTWWRAKWTIAGASARFPIFVSFGIL